jgi:hypothetical protein
MDHRAKLAFAQYARAQVTRAATPVNKHHDDRGGTCGTCRLVTPCATSDCGQALIHYGQFVRLRVGRFVDMAIG